MTFCLAELCVISCCLFHDEAAVVPGPQTVPTYFNHPALEYDPDDNDPDPGYFESQPIIEFPESEYGDHDEAEYPDQALLCPDYSTYPDAHNPDEDNLDGSGYEY